MISWLREVGMERGPDFLAQRDGYGEGPEFIGSERWVWTRVGFCIWPWIFDGGEILFVGWGSLLGKNFREKILVWKRFLVNVSSIGVKKAAGGR